MPDVVVCEDGRAGWYRVATALTGEHNKKVDTFYSSEYHVVPDMGKKYPQKWAVSSWRHAVSRYKYL